MASFPFIVATTKESVLNFQITIAAPQTSVEMGLLGELIVRVTVCVDRSIELFKRHEGMHKLIISMEKSS